MFPLLKISMVRVVEFLNVSGIWPQILTLKVKKAIFLTTLAQKVLQDIKKSLEYVIQYILILKSIEFQLTTCKFYNCHHTTEHYVMPTLAFQYVPAG